MTKTPKIETRTCKGCPKIFAVQKQGRGRPKLYHDDACQKKDWAAKHPRQAMPE